MDGKTFRVLLSLFITLVYLASLVLLHEVSHQQAAEYFGLTASAIKLGGPANPDALAYVDVSDPGNVSQSSIELFLFSAGLFDAFLYHLAPFSSLLVFVLFYGFLEKI